MFSNLTKKNVIRIWCYETMEKPVAGSSCLFFNLFMGNAFLWKQGYRCFQSWYRNKLFASNEKQIDSHTLMLVMLHSNMSVLCTYLYIGAFKKIFWCGFCSLLIFLAKKATKGTELQFLCTQGTLKGGRVENHRMMFTIGTCIHHNYIFKQYST